VGEDRNTQENDDPTPKTGPIDEVRQRIDILRLQLDLGKLDALDAVAAQLDIAQNACLAAHAKLRDAWNDLTSTAEALRDGLEKIVEDGKAAIDAVEDTVSRG
jgi:hypothetical protein